MLPSSHRRRVPQISLAVMMLMMVIFAVIFAGGLYAIRVPAVQADLDVLLGNNFVAGSDDGSGHLAHIVFIMFTLTSPLLLAGVLSMGLSAWRWFQRQA
ncbi:hypothetical protein [Novipirellula rosea]